MQKYAIIEEEELKISSEQTKGYIPLVYAPVPDFDQEKEYVIQSNPVDEVDNIFLGVEIKTMQYSQPISIDPIVDKEPVVETGVIK